MSRFPVRRAPAAVGALVVLALGFISAPSASSAPLPAEPTPLAIISPVPHPACPSPAEFDGSGTAAELQKLVTETGPTSTDADLTTALAMLVWMMVPQNVAGICDPDLAAAGAPLQPLAGDIASQTVGVVGAGLRSRVMVVGDSALQPGDRVNFPAAGPASTISLTAMTPHGLARLSGGPFATAPTSVSIGGSAATPTATVTLTDGAAVQLPFSVPSPTPSPTATSTHKRTSLRLTVRADAGSILIASAEAIDAASTTRNGDARDAENTDGLIDLAATNETGVARLRLSGLTPSIKTATLTAMNIPRGTIRTSTCKLRWKRKRLRSVKCAKFRAPAAASTATRPAPANRPARRRPATGAWPTQAIAAPSTPAEANAITRVHARVAPAARRNTAAARVSVVHRFTKTETRRGLLDILPAELSVGDVTGDGTPDVLYRLRSSGTAALKVSGANGRWRTRAVRTWLLDDAITPDLTGDGLDDVWNGNDAVVHRGRRAWGTGSGPLSLTTVRPGDMKFAADLDFGANAGEAVVDSLFSSAPPQPPIAFATTAGNGSPAIAVHSDDSSGALAVYPRETFGTTLAAPLPMLRTVADDLSAGNASGEGWGPPETALGDALDGPSAAGPRVILTGGRTNSLLATLAYEDAAGSAPAVPEQLRVLRQTAPWGYGPAITLPAGRRHEVLAFDSVTGHAAVSGRSPGCARAACQELLSWIAPDGRVVGRVRLPRRDVAEHFSAAFTDDADGDGVPELLLTGRFERRGLLQPVLVWHSLRGSAKHSALPALYRAVGPLATKGDLTGWVSPQGKRFVAAHGRLGRGSKAPTGLLLIRGLR